MGDDEFTVLRERMIEVISAHAEHAASHLGRESIDARVLAAMGAVERHDFVPSELRAYAYFDTPLPIGYEKTVSQPFIVALMTDLLRLRPNDRVLEVGTGLGYHAAILSKLAGEIFTVEIVEELGKAAASRLNRHGCKNVTARIGDGGHGWPEAAPFDAILVAAAPELLPAALIHQMKAGGRMVCPAGVPGAQQLMLLEKNDAGRLTVHEILPVNFAPLEQPS
jgi:protein-L-isoaspartate(D-aspartate) O-methyltransferase